VLCNVNFALIKFCLRKNSEKLGGLNLFLFDTIDRHA